jgi:fatty-acyl-CoA synthase
MTKLKTSYVKGTSDVPLIDDCIGVYFDKLVDRFPDEESLVVKHQGIRWTYRELQVQVDKFAAGLIALGLERGDRIGIWSPNNSEWVVTQLAAAKAGLILVNINPAYRLAELEYALNQVGCKALIAAERFKTSDYMGMLRQLAPELDGCEGELRAGRLPALRTVILIEGSQINEASLRSDAPAEPFAARALLKFDEVASAGEETHREKLRQLTNVLHCDDPINIQFTSGTTGFPKGATLTHRNVLNNGFFVGEAMRLTFADRICIPVPLYHCFGMVLGNLACLTHGATMIYPSEAFEPLAVLQTIADERCTGLHGVPTMFLAEVDHPEFSRFDLSSLRTGIMAGSPCPIELMKRVNREMHMNEITICYGMTETSPVSFQSAVDDPVDRRVSTVGRVHPHVEVKIVDAEGEIVPTGVTGELCTRGYSVMRGYWSDPERTSEVLDSEQWMHTGDLATIDEDGYCNIVGRLKDMVIRGGENIYPREVEEFLYRHPQIQEVQVFGVPSVRLGEELCAWIRLREGESATAEDIISFCRDQISHYKVPRHIKFVDSFPMTVTGKIQKFVMRAQMIEELDLQVEHTA